MTVDRIQLCQTFHQRTDYNSVRRQCCGLRIEVTWLGTRTQVQGSRSKAFFHSCFPPATGGREHEGEQQARLNHPRSSDRSAGRDQPGDSRCAELCLSGSGIRPMAIHAATIAITSFPRE
jgi:hypothetical protein